jgi:hypothetical protein
VVGLKKSDIVSAEENDSLPFHQMQNKSRRAQSVGHDISMDYLPWPKTDQFKLSDLADSRENLLGKIALIALRRELLKDRIVCEGHTPEQEKRVASHAFKSPWD